MPADTKDINKVVQALKGWKFGYLWYLSYQNGETGILQGRRVQPLYGKTWLYQYRKRNYSLVYRARVTPDVL